VIEPRLYRAAFLPAFVAVLLVAFSFQQQPPPDEQPPAGGVIFDGESAARAARELAASTPDRRAGTPGDMAVAAMVRKTLAARRFATQVDRWTDDNGKALENVVGIKPGRSERQVVVIAARDAHTTPDTAGSAADTTALLEVARVLQGRASTRTVVLISADGSAYGDAGVRRWIETSASPSLIDGVIVMDQLGASRSAGPLVTGWANSHDRTSIGLQRTAQNSLAQELGQVPMEDSFFRQVPRVALPIGLGGQGPLVTEGIDAVRITGSGEIDPPTSDQLNTQRYEELGRGVMRLFSALNDEGRPGHGPGTYLTLGTKYLPGWAIGLLGLALLLPLIIASVDAFARARRQREPVALWFAWLGAGFFALVIGWLIAEATVLVGLTPHPPPAPLQPALIEFDGSASAAVVATLVLAVAAWWLLRRALGLAEKPGAGAGVAIALAGTVLGLITLKLNPYMGLVLVFPLHAMLLASLTPMRRIPALAMVLVGAIPPALLVGYYMAHFNLGPLHAVWYAFLLITGGQPGWLATTLALVFVALFVSTLILVVVREPEDAYGDGGRRLRGMPSEPRLPILGPGGHAGPGSLGNARTFR
jgi:hypothetical protein